MRYTHILIHILLWLSYFLILVYTSPQILEIDQTLLLGLRTILLHAFLFYVNTQLLIPFVFEKKKYFAYPIIIILLLTVAMSALWLSNEIQFIKEAIGNMRSPRMRYNNGILGISSKWIFSNLVSFMAILFISTLYSLINISRKKEEQEMNQKNETLQSELKFLKSQISPHFLFNALNNIYALSFTGSKKTPEMILKLSEMLRYVLYDCNVAKVPLQLELAYIANYIDLQKLKEETDPNIYLNHEAADNNLKIVPLLLIPFIENSFKHGNIENTQQGFIKINLNTQAHILTFYIENSISNTIHPKDKIGGIGLINVKRRLELLYPNKHQLSIEHTNDSFSVTLELDTHEN